MYFINNFLLHPVKTSIFLVIYSITFLFLGPIIDHLFTTLEEDEKKKENNLDILKEVIYHLIAIAFIWYISYLLYEPILIKLLHIKNETGVKITMNIIRSIILIGTQRSLLDKIKYLTFTHPIKLTDFKLF
tara:strand:+ start:52 stop:444 length:393 start_codon:yes stop_codon:yes gene_type:complete